MLNELILINNPQYVDFYWVSLLQNLKNIGFNYVLVESPNDWLFDVINLTVLK